MAKKKKADVGTYVSTSGYSGKTHDVDGSIITQGQITRYNGKEVIYFRRIGQNGRGLRRTGVPGYLIVRPVEIENSVPSQTKYQFARITTQEEQKNIVELLMGIGTVGVRENIKFW